MNPPHPDLGADAAETSCWRPRYRYTPERHWMNDPNGLVFHAGEFHLHYQHNPQGADWDRIGWGHAVSTDLVSWQELPMAITASDRVMAFSGSVVVDHANTAGFAPLGSTEPALVACFTGFDPITKIQSQHLAYSLDRGRSYTSYAGNPVIDIQSKEFRDPKVFWHAPDQHWVMVLVAALQQQVWIYTSRNLKDWTRVSTFGPAGSADQNIWEVPDLVELPVRAADGQVTGKRWVMMVSVVRGTLWGGSGVQYFIGDFDGRRFTQEASGAVPAISGATLWADHGRDFYAPITFSNVPDGRVLGMGWMSNWDYARQLPTRPWRGQMSSPRELDLVATPHGLRLRQTIAREMTAQAQQGVVLQRTDCAAPQAARALLAAHLASRTLMLRLVVATEGLQAPIGFALFGGAVWVGFDPHKRSFFVDRSRAPAHFVGHAERHDAARVLDAPELSMEVWIDACIVELFADGGTVVISDLAFADPQALGVSLFHGAENPGIKALTVCELGAADGAGANAAAPT